MAKSFDSVPDDIIVAYGAGDAVISGDRPVHRRRREVDSLLTMAEELQDGLERKSQQFLISFLFLIFAIAAGAVGFAIVVFAGMTVVYKLSIGTAAALYLVVTLILFYRSQNRFEVQRRRDRNALNEVLAILHDVEPILRASNEWSRLDEAQFRIRLARFDVGRSAKVIPNIADLRIDNFTRTMRFLLDESNTHYRNFVEKVFQNIDVAVKNLMEARDFDDVMRRAGALVEIVADHVDFNAIVDESRRGPDTTTVTSRLVTAQWGGSQRNYAIFQDGRVVMNAATKRDFESRQQQLRIQLGETI